MTKSEIVDLLAESLNLSKKEVHGVVEGLLSEIEVALKKGEKVTFTGFGTFEAVKRDARAGRNPQTGAAIEIPARTAPKFSPGKALRDSLDQATSNKK